MVEKVECESTKDDNDAQNCGRKGGKFTTKNEPCTRKGNSNVSQLLNGEHVQKMTQ